jgi:hypothetical protein
MNGKPGLPGAESIMEILAAKTGRPGNIGFAGLRGSWEGKPAAAEVCPGYSEDEGQDGASGYAEANPVDDTLNF